MCAIYILMDSFFPRYQNKRKRESISDDNTSDFFDVFKITLMLWACEHSSGYEMCGILLLLFFNPC